MKPTGIGVVKRIKYIQWHIGCIVSRVQEPGQLRVELDNVIKALKGDESSSNKRERLLGIKRKGLITDPGLLDGIAKAFDDNKDNRGHEGACYKATSKEVDANDLMMAKIARVATKTETGTGGVWFTCQTKCAEGAKPKKAGEL